MSWQIFRQANAQERIADGAAAVSAAAAGWTWLASLNEILQVVATLVAIGAGVYAIRYHRRKLRELDEGPNDS